MKVCGAVPQSLVLIQWETAQHILQLQRCCCQCCALLIIGVIREFQRLRRQQQRDRRIKIELCVKLRLLRSFHVGHVVQNRRSALSLALHEWRFSYKGKEWKIYCCELPLSSEPQIWNKNFTSSFVRLRQNIAPKSVPHVQHDYFSSFNQSNHWPVAFLVTLPSSNLKLPN